MRLAGGLTPAARAAALFAGLAALAAVAPGGGGARAQTDPPYVAGPYETETTVDEMSRTMGRAYVRAIQRELAARGYAPGDADGREGPRTRGAIRAYQREAGLRETGRASRELLDHLKFAVPRIHAGGVSVRNLQRRLAAGGYYAGAIDGIPGPRTREAARRFQADMGLETTGVLDDRLARALDRAGIAAR